jgi:hypothetical protein
LLVEAVIMLIAMVVSSRWVMRRFNVAQTLGSTIPMGLVALAILAPPRSRVSYGCEGYRYRNICEIRDRSQRHFGGDVPAVNRNAVSGRTINTPPRRRDLLSLLVHAKDH